MRSAPIFTPGPLSRESSRELTEYLRFLGRALRIQAVAPLSVRQDDNGIALWNEAGAGDLLKARWIRFHLAGSLLLTDSSQAGCTVDYYWDGPNPGATVTVQNLQAFTNFTFAGKTGFSGLAVYDPGANVYRIVELENLARWIRFTLVATLAVTDASQAGVPVNYYWDGESPGSTITVYNQPASVNYMFNGTTGKVGLASYDPLHDRFWIVQLEC